MKKVIALFLVVILCCGILCSCDLYGCAHIYNSATCTEPETCSQCGETRGSALGHTYNPATCTEPETCSQCGETRGSALGHTTSTGTCTRCGISFSKWEKRNYIDEFKNPTGEAFIAPTNNFTGTFSNSATTNSELDAFIRVNDDTCEILLWEYGSNMVKAYSTTDYNITILLANGTKKYFTGTMYKNGFTINLDDYNGIVSLLKNNNGVVTFYIKENSKYGFNSSYLFEVNTSGFKEVYNKTFK